MRPAHTSVVVTALLAAREPMHKLLRETLTHAEQRDALIFLLFALVVLPIARWACCWSRSVPGSERGSLVA